MINSTLKDVIQKKNNDVTHLNKEFYAHKNKLKIFKTLQIGEKIGKNDDGEYWVYENNFFQKGLRLWHGENRYRTISQLDIDYRNFLKFLDTFIDFYSKNDDSFNFLKRNICIFIDQLIQGLYNLKQTYSGFKEIESKIDSIILTMLDFKNSVNRIQSNKKKSMNIVSWNYNSLL